ncbi:zinc ABC transporter substrate-binding protein [Bacillus sp. ISL-40]|uniref:metal ABC transporter substrate-binding protein n=1 Tax=unclassified Bacillus (in: firmicutes) TaxID=185979 RepID=UPI001BEAD978|nr:MULTISPECIES: metal ABC transporter substrate-binding protein [unclassified Bacillus (in: firmicutes)]MBT2696135.1 zinc ABC transporter substrate-binding protein [Bacillus sp. ISL-40]MBT2742982.1 zinc ABC transporter substrate-binding protein [Bacillus sp. ISL-77]
MKKLIGTFIIFLLFLSGCSNAVSTKNEKTSEGSNKLQIVTTFYPMYYFAQKVAGNSANVELLVPNGAEPHDWEPTAKDMAKIQDADMFIYNSRYFESWTEKVLKSINDSNLNVVEASNGIELMDALESEEEEHNSEHASAKDPHVWLSPVLAQQEVENIAKALEHADPKNKDQFEKNAADLNSQLTDLDRLYKETIDKAKKKEFVTQHAAFGYLAKQYGLTQIPIAGLSPDVEPTLGKLAALTELTKKDNVKIIYFEELTSSKVAQTLADEIGAKTEVLNPLEGLTKEEQEKGLDYIDVMKKNLEALKLSILE